MWLIIQRWHCAGQLQTRFAIYDRTMARCYGSVVIARASGPVACDRKRHAWRIV